MVVDAYPVDEDFDLAPMDPADFEAQVSATKGRPVQVTKLNGEVIYGDSQGISKFGGAFLLHELTPPGISTDHQIPEQKIHSIASITSEIIRLAAGSAK